MRGHEPDLVRHILSVDDLDLAEIDGLLDRARAIRVGEEPSSDARGVLGLLFLSSSLRTRVGFAAAGARCGLAPVEIPELRWEAGMTTAESFEDSLRVITGMVDLLVVRTPFELDRQLVERNCAVPVISGGDGSNEHPIQGLIDLAAIETECGPVEELSIGIVGDLGMHVSRSLVKLLGHRPPGHLRLMAPATRDALGIDLPTALADRAVFRHALDLEGLDVVYVAGLPEGSGEERLDAHQRGEFAITPDSIRSLAPEAVVLCPLPMIDEVDRRLRDHHQVRVFEQSDRGTSIRMAVLEWALSNS
jgi:aspartate carbamoyltransferase catalytic subunit